MDGLSSPTSKAGRLQRAALAVIEAHRAEDALPTSIRFVFYELLTPAALPKKAPAGMKRTPAQNLSDAFMVLREARLVPWEDLVDETRSLSEWDHAPNVVEYMADRLPEARLNPWASPPPLLLAESRSEEHTSELQSLRHLVCR